MFFSAVPLCSSARMFCSGNGVQSLDRCHSCVLTSVPFFPHNQMPIWSSCTFDCCLNVVVQIFSVRDVTPKKGPVLSSVGTVTNKCLTDPPSVVPGVEL